MEKSDRPTNWAVFVLDSMFIVVIYARIANYWYVSVVVSTNSLCLMFASFRLDYFFVFSFNIYKSFWLFRYLLKIVLKNEKACIVDNIPNFYLKKKQIKSPIFLAQATAKTLSAIFWPLFYTPLIAFVSKAVYFYHHKTTKYSDLISFSHLIICFTCKHWSRYSRERASQSLQTISQK